MDPFEEIELFKEREASESRSRIMMSRPALEQDTTELANRFINLQKVGFF